MRPESATLISAALKVRGARSRRQTLARDLFRACAEVRRRIKGRWRGPGNRLLRVAWGEGLAASPAKPQTVLALARRIMLATATNEDALRPARITAPMIERITRLAEELAELPEEVQRLVQARRETWEAEGRRPKRRRRPRLAS